MTMIQQSKATPWAAPVGLLAVGTFALGTDSFILAGILPQVSRGLGVSPGAAGQSVTVFALTYVPDFFEKLGFSRVDKATLPHKIWAECINCPKFPDCDETALLKTIAK